VKRARFLVASAAAAAAFPLVGASDDRRSLRVLLGKGDARPVTGGGFEFQGRHYRGSYSRQPGGGIINTVALDEYLYSVVPREMASSWPPSALQAQAICARTFVLRHASAKRPYDVVSSNLNQVYQGVGTESSAGHQAVDATNGMVLRYGDGIAEVAYSSCCGGHTESAADVWGGAPTPYLAGVVCPYCVDSPEYHWTLDLAFDDIARALSSPLHGAGALRDVRLGRRDESGRVTEVELLTDRTTVVVSGNDFRLDVGPKLVRSLLISSLIVQPPEGELTSPFAHMEGAGSGHGVGLCQWGARGFALLHGSVAHLLAFYFPGTTIDTWTNVPSPPTSTSFRRR
jgi:stage II sporulation protein D